MMQFALLATVALCFILSSSRGYLLNAAPHLCSAAFRCRGIATTSSSSKPPACRRSLVAFALSSSSSAAALQNSSSSSSSSSFLSPTLRKNAEETAAQLLGGVVGRYVIGGNLGGVLGARLLKRQMTKFPDSELGKIVTHLATASLDSFQYLSDLDEKYQWSSDAWSGLVYSYNEFKYSGMVDRNKVDKAEKNLRQLREKAVALNEQYDFCRLAETAAETIEVGIENAIEKARSFAQDYQLVEKSTAAIGMLGDEFLSRLEGSTKKT